LSDIWWDQTTNIPTDEKWPCNDYEDEWRTSSVILMQENFVLSQPDPTIIETAFWTSLGEMRLFEFSMVTFLEFGMIHTLAIGNSHCLCALWNVNGQMRKRMHFASRVAWKSGKFWKNL
jgi:hypothetical protein